MPTKLPRIWRPPGETLPRGKWGVVPDFPLAALAFVWSFKTFTFMPLATASTGPLVVASIVLLFVVGIPLLFIETGIGQMTGYGSAMALRRMCPLLGGTGYVVILHAVIICMQYSIFASWSLYYGFALLHEALSATSISSSVAPTYDPHSGESTMTLLSASSQHHHQAGDWKLLGCNNDYNTDLCVRVEDWNACNITWFEDKLEEALVADDHTPAESVAALGENSLLAAVTPDTITTTTTMRVDVLVDRRAGHHDEAAVATPFTNSVARRRYLDSNIFRKEYEDNRHCVSSAEEYFTHYVLHIGASLGDIGAPVGHLLPCLLVVWILAFLAACKGSRTLALMAWVVIISSVFVLIAITLGTLSFLDLTVGEEHGEEHAKPAAVVSSNTQPNSTAKWNDYFDGVVTGEKRHTSLLDISVWMQAAEFVLITILFGTGNLTTLASYNRRRNNLMRDVFIIGVGHLAICLLVNANMTLWLQYVIDTARRRAGLQFDFHEWRDWTLLFIVSPLILKRQAHALLWAMLFYIMTFLVALSTLYTALETLANFVQDEFLERLRNKTVRVTAVVASVGFVLSVFFTTRAGVFWLKLINHFINGTSLTIMLLIVVLVFVFGIERFKDGMRRSIYGHEHEPGGHQLTRDDTRGRWFFTYFHYGCYASVVVIILTLLWILVINSPPLQYYGSGKPYPLWAHIACFMMAVGCLSPIVIYPVYRGVNLWPELRAEQQQQSVSDFIAGKDGRLNGNMRRADSEILRRLQRSSSSSHTLGSNRSNGSNSAAKLSTSRLNDGQTNESNSKPLEEHKPLMPGAAESPANDNKTHSVVFFHADSDDTDVNRIPTPTLTIDDTKQQQQQQNGSTNLNDHNNNNNKKRVKFSSPEPIMTTTPSSPDRLSNVSPTTSEKGGVTSNGTMKNTNKSCTMAKLLTALIKPQSYKLSIADTGYENDDDAEAMQPDGDDDDDIFKRNKKEAERNFALRLSSTRDDDDDLGNIGGLDTSLQFLHIPMTTCRPSSANSSNGGVGRRLPADTDALRSRLSSDAKM